MSVAKLQPTVEPISETSLRLIKSYASDIEADPNEFSIEQTGKPLESLTRQQGLEVLRAILKLQRPKPSHTHPCFECGVDVMCSCDGPNESRLKQLCTNIQKLCITKSRSSVDAKTMQN